jgi:proteasome accessory factor B
MPKDYSRIHRLLKILMLIQGDSAWTAARLAQECGTSERNIYRDLKMLEGAGVPYHFDEQRKGYRVRGDFFMPAVPLTLEESLALVALARHVGGAEQVPFLKAAERAVEKVRCNLPRPVQAELDRHDNTLAIQLAASHPPEASQDVYDTVRHAIATRTALQCEYDSVGGEKNGSRRGVFALKPYVLFFGQRAWYVIGHHGGRNAVRCLKLNRFTRCQPTRQTYTVPADFSLKKHLGNAWRMIRGDTTYTVKLQFDAQFAETVADTHWHATQHIDWHDDGSITFHCKVDGLDEIVWWVLGMGPHCRVIGPKELASRVRELAGQMLRLYPQD